MAAKSVCVLFYLLLAGVIVSGFTLVTYPTIEHSLSVISISPVGSTVNKGSRAAAGSSWLQPSQEQILSGNSFMFPISFLRLLPDTCFQWLTSAGLL